MVQATLSLAFCLAAQVSAREGEGKDGRNLHFHKHCPSPNGNQENPFPSPGPHRDREARVYQTVRKQIPGTGRLKLLSGASDLEKGAALMKRPISPLLGNNPKFAFYSDVRKTSLSNGTNMPALTSSTWHSGLLLRALLPARVLSRHREAWKPCLWGVGGEHIVGRCKKTPVNKARSAHLTSRAILSQPGFTPSKMLWACSANSSRR